MLGPVVLGMVNPQLHSAVEVSLLRTLVTSGSLILCTRILRPRHGERCWIFSNNLGQSISAQDSTESVPRLRKYNADTWPLHHGNKPSHTSQCIPEFL